MKLQNKIKVSLAFLTAISIGLKMLVAGLAVNAGEGGP